MTQIPLCRSYLDTAWPIAAFPGLEEDLLPKAWRQTESAGRISQTLRDLAGRTTKTIENYVDGNVSETEAGDSDRTTEYLYNTKGQLATQRAYNPLGVGKGVQQQDTQYLYESSLSGSLQTDVLYPDSADTDSSGTDQVTFTYDQLGRKVTSTDQRGVVHQYAYDPAGRLASDTATSLGRADQNVDGTVRRVEYVYQDDGKVRTITTFDADTGGSILNQVKYTYDGWGDLKSEQSHAGAVTDGTPAVTYSYEDGADENGNAQYLRLKKVTYPAGRMLYCLYESTSAGRLTSVSENSSGTQKLVQYTYLGLSRIMKETRPQVAGGGLSLDNGGIYSGWDRFGRIVMQQWKRSGSLLMDAYLYDFNSAGDKTLQKNLINSSLTETYTYDGLSRLIDTNRGGADLQNWGLDAVGNWDQFTDGATVQTREQNAANETTSISGSWVDPAYDAAGNMVSGPKAGDETTRLHYVYDPWNRLVAEKADDGGEPGSVIATYQYDGRGFRTQKVLAGGDTFDYYYNEQHQVLEVRKNGSANAYEQYVYGQRYVDELVMVYRDTNTDGVVEQNLYVLQDANFNVTATVNGASGQIVNRFIYTPYGQRTVLTATWTAGTTDFMLGHQGLYLDGESGLYYNRARYLHPTLGSFTTRDPLGYVDGANVYQYECGNPTANTDPLGLRKAHNKSSERALRPGNANPNKKRDCSKKCPSGQEKTVIILGDVSNSEPWWKVGPWIGGELAENRFYYVYQRLVAEHERAGETVVPYPGGVSEAQMQDIVQDPCTTKFIFIGHSAQDRGMPEDPGIHASNGVFIPPSQIQEWRNNCEGPQDVMLRSCNQAMGGNKKAWQDAWGTDPSKLRLPDYYDRWWYVSDPPPLMAPGSH